jgi:hypothetical protein
MKNIEKLIGVSAGKICFTNFNDYDFFLSKLLEEASIVWESGRSAWTLLSQDVSGRTCWLSPDEDQAARVSAQGDILIETLE